MYKKFFPCRITSTLKTTRLYIWSQKHSVFFASHKIIFWISVKILITDRALRVQVGKDRKVFTADLNTKCAYMNKGRVADSRGRTQKT